MTNYIFATDPHTPEAVFIIKTAFPSIVARVIMFSDKMDMEDFKALKASVNSFNGAQVPGYSILIVPAGELPMDKPRSREPVTIWHEMADFFLTNKILKNERPYRRSKII